MTRSCWWSRTTASASIRADPQTAETDLGLLGMRERAALIGARSRSNRRPARGQRSFRSAVQAVQRLGTAVTASASCWPRITRPCARACELLIDRQRTWRSSAKPADGRMAVEACRALQAGRRGPRHLDAGDERAGRDACNQESCADRCRRGADAPQRRRVRAGAVGAGALGYVLKQSPSSELLDAVRAAAAGAATSTQPGSRAPDGRPRPATAPKPPITDRESEVLAADGVGHSNKEIATQLN